jgi:proton-dependent oligopeptide transporter, POT family
MSNPQKHPPGIYTLFFTEMWERMSYYGMRALLVLFMVDQMRGGMGLADAQAAAIYGLYTALVYVAALPGGWVGDRLLGAKQSVWWGGIVIAAGHLTLAIPDARAFYVGLIVIALGSGLLKSNMSALVGRLYPEGGARRDAGFTLFYMGINIGALIGQIVCSNLGEHIAWKWGFSVAAAGMILGLVQFKLTRHHLDGIGDWQPLPGQNVRRDRALFLGALAGIVLLVVLCVSGVIGFDPVRVAKGTSSAILAVAVLFFLWAFLFAGLTAEEKKRMAVIVILFFAAVVFFAGFEQAGSSFSLFAERYTDRVVGRWTLAAGMFQSLNPLFVVTLSPVVAALWLTLARRNAEPSLAVKLSWGLLVMAGGFVLAALASSRALATGPVNPSWLVSIYLLHTIGELFLSPVGLSAVTKLSPPRLTGQMMGVWFLGTSLGNLLAGLLAGEVSGDEAARMPERFLQVVWTAGGVGVLLWVCSRWIQRLMPGIK